MESGVASQCYPIETDSREIVARPAFIRFVGLSFLTHVACLSGFMFLHMRLPVTSSYSPPISIEIHDMEIKEPEPPPPAEKAPRLAPPPAPLPKTARVTPPTPTMERTPAKTVTAPSPMPPQPASASADAVPVSAPAGPAAPAAPGPAVSGPARPGPATVTGTGTSNSVRDFTFGSGNGPSFLAKADPYYPLAARRMGREGRVLLRLTLDERGKLLHVDVLENPGYGFADSAVEAVRKSRFLPARINGQPVACRVRLPIRFALQPGE